MSKLFKFNIITQIVNVPITEVSGTAHTTLGTDFCSPTIINTMIPSYRLQSLSLPTYSPPWYWALCCKCISSAIKIVSVEIQSHQCSNLTALKNSTPPLWILYKNWNEGRGKCYNINLWDTAEVYCCRSAYLITFTE